MDDQASFNRDHLQAIWGEYPECVQLRGRPAEHFHHILKRGHDFGARPSSEFRVVFSSVFNAVALSPTAHNLGDIHRQDKVKEYLIRAQVEVMKAVERGAYQITENDKLFLNFVACWWDNPHGHGLLEQAAAMPLADIQRYSISTSTKSLSP